MIIIRDLAHSELGALKSVAVASFDKTFGPVNTPANMEFYYATYYSTEQMEKDFAEAGSATFMAWDDVQPAGFVRLRESDEVAATLGPNSVELQRLYVHPDYQGKSIGSMLMQKAMDYARSTGYEWIWLGVWERNFPAQKFYDKWGFEKFAEHIFQMGDDPQTDWLLKRRV